MLQNEKYFYEGAGVNECSNYLEIQRKMQMLRLDEETKNNLSIQKRQALSQIETLASIERAETRADIESERELQKTLIHFSADGEVVLTKESFGRDIKGKLSIKVLAAQIYCHIDNPDYGVLVVGVEKGNGKQCAIFGIFKSQKRVGFEQHLRKMGYHLALEKKRKMKFDGNSFLPWQTVQNR